VISGYNKKAVLSDVSFNAEKAGVYVVLGTNGAGKTTLFRTIAGVIDPFSGEIILDGEEIISSRKIRKRISYLSHNNAIPEEMTVQDALEFWSNMENDGIGVERVIELLDLHELAQKKFSELSDGQKKRVSIATIFMGERDLYLLDEPTSGLDPIFSKKIRDFILEMGKDKIVLYSSHNLYEATEIGTHLVLVRNGTVEYYEEISNIKSSHYRIGIKASPDIARYVDVKVEEGGYFVLTLSNREEAASIMRKLVANGVHVYEMRALDDPLQDLFKD
jgi:ABC-2 type transport system ATP-binding protein